ncbi:GntR family transcriptional regulator [Ruminococcus sp. CLA-AA-H200]|uniref:GntR family transcriptional regulator n=1 Tax=Ruminococcus turbiniformis TaxID=2881258 RepID=A0ABS8FTU2_9FIRM|nr:GntR family transcriptional regulator [Ruminococcus turbiniformis]MCC2253397.1 GntR family transcriptional regulator [Ruminococcus turbiniformis]
MTQIIKRVPYHLQAYELLKRQILTGKLSCGDTVNELLLSQELGISRSPVREAIRMLESDRLVVTERGTHIVNPLDEKTLNDVYECRICLESYAARLAVRHCTRKDYETLLGFVEKCRKADPVSDAQLLIDESANFHSYIVSLAQNTYLSELIERISNLVTLSRIKELKYYNRDLSYAYVDHTHIAEILLEGNEDKAEQVMREHLRNNRSSLMP